MRLIKTDSFEIAVNEYGDKNAKKLALVLPGRLDSKDYYHMVSHAKFLAKKGYFAVSFDPPGTWDSPGDISIYKMSNYHKAIDELIDFYGGKPTLCVGHSRGSSMSIVANNTNNKVIGFVAIMCSLIPGAYTNGVDEVWEKQGYYDFPRDLPPGGGPKDKVYRLPYSFFEDQRAYDLEEGLRNSNNPKLFIYGKHDDLATPDKVKQLYKLANAPKEIYELDNDHDYRHSPDKISEVEVAMGEFLDEYQLI